MEFLSQGLKCKNEAKLPWLLSKTLSFSKQSSGERKTLT